MGFSLRKSYLVMFIVLCSAGVSAAFAVGTITLSGDVNVQNGDLGIGINDGTNDDTIKFDDGTRTVMWDDSETQFEFSDAIVTPGVIQAGTGLADVAYNRIGAGTANSGAVSANNDLFVTGNIETDGNLFADALLFVGTDIGTDDDSICMDGPGCTESILWHESQTQFEFSDAIVTSGVIQAGNSLADVGYNRIGTGFASGVGMTTTSDFFVTGDVETDGNLFADSVLWVGTDDGTDNDIIVMDSIGSLELISWDDTDSRFEITDDLDVDGVVSPPVVAYTDESHDSVKQIISDWKGIDNIFTFYNYNSKRMEYYNLSEDKFYNFIGEEIPYISSGIPANSILNQEQTTIEFEQIE